MIYSRLYGDLLYSANYFWDCSIIQISLKLEIGDAYILQQNKDDNAHRYAVRG